MGELARDKGQWYVIADPNKVGEMGRENES